MFAAEFLPILMVFAITGASILLFISEKVPIEGVAFLVLLSLLLTGLVGENEILSGFSNPATITVMCMFILSAGLQRTGIIRYVAAQLNKMAGTGRTKLTLVISTICGAFSAFISNTATVAVLLPVTITLCKERGVSPTRVLMPLSFAAQFGGVCTLIGTTTNLLVNSIAQDSGLVGFSMFEFAKLGLICFGIGMVYMLIASRFLLKDNHDLDNFTSEYRLSDYVIEMEVQEDSPLIGQTITDNELTKLDGEIRLLEIIRGGKMIWAVKLSTIQQGDILLIRGDVQKVMEAESHLKLKDWAEGNLSERHLSDDNVSLMEVMLPNGSRLINKTLNQMDFYWRYHAAVLGIRRHGEVMRERVANIRFEEGDTLLLQGQTEDLEHLARDEDFMMLQDLSVLKLRTKRATIALLIMGGVIFAAASGMFSILTAALVGAAAMVISRCITLNEAYKAVDFQVLLLLAGLIPLGLAMRSSGAADWLVAEIMAVVGDSGPLIALAAIYGLTMFLTAFMSNAATAVLLSPLAITVAASLGVNAEPFLVAVAFAASTCFMTPVGYQTNTMIYGPGGYKYSDFIKVGAPLNTIFLVVSVLLIPTFWPF